MSEEIKPGVKTSEFWIAVLGIVGAVVPSAAALVGGNPTAAAAIAVIAMILPALYIWGRAILKAEATKQTNVIPDKWEPLFAKVLDVAETLAKGLPAKPAEPTEPADSGAG